MAVITHETPQAGPRRTPIGQVLDLPAVEVAVRAMTGRTFLDRAAAALFALMILATAAYAWLKPDYNWDMVAYVASALEGRISDPVELHAETWKVIEQGATPAQLDHLKYSSDYNRHQWENPVDFESQLSMYRVKYGYVLALRALEPVVGLATGARLLSILPAIGIGLLGLWWLARERALQGAVLLAPLLFLASWDNMALAVSPDLLVCLLALCGLYALWRGRDAAGCVFLFASVFVRPDSLITIFALLIASFLFNWRKLPLLLTFLASLVVYVALSKAGGHPGWWPHFYFSCVEMQNSLIGFHPDFSLGAFLRGYARGGLWALFQNFWPWLFVVMLAGWALLHRAGRTTARGNAIMFALAIGILGKFASFPLPEDRLQFFFMAGMAMVLIAMWKPRFDREAA